MSDFLPMFHALDIRTGQRRSAHDDSQPIFEQVLGDAFDALPMPIRELHSGVGVTRYSGRASVARGGGLLARAVGWLARFPDAQSDVPVSVTISQRGTREEWTRDFDGHTFSSELSAGSQRLTALLCERFGPVKFGMALVADGDRLRYVSRRWTILGIPMPKWLMPNGAMYETVSDGKFVFHVEIKFPIVGHVVTYAGNLQKID